MFARAQTRRLEEAESQPIRQRSEDVRFALLLTYITLGWMTVEGAASLLLGWASKSLLLEAFGIDSVVELFSAAVWSGWLGCAVCGGACVGVLWAGGWGAGNVRCSWDGGCMSWLG